MIASTLIAASFLLRAVWARFTSGAALRSAELDAGSIRSRPMRPGSASLQGPKLRSILMLGLSIIGPRGLTRATGRTVAAVATCIASTIGRRPSGILEVTISYVLVEQGPVYVGLFDANAPFPRVGAQLRGAVVAARSSTVASVFNDVPYGRYAIAAFQDVNENGVLDFALGVPIEPFGFSNGATAGVEAPPTFADAAIRVGTPISSVAIALHPGAAMQARTYASRSRLPAFLLGVAQVLGGFGWPAGASAVRRLKVSPASVAELARAAHADVERRVAATISSSGPLDRASRTVVGGAVR